VSVIVTSLFGSAPWSPLPLTVDVMAYLVAVPSPFTTPVRLRRPSVAGAHGSSVAGLLPVGYPGTVYGTPRFRPACNVYTSIHLPWMASKIHFCNPAVFWAAAFV